MDDIDNSIKDVNTAAFPILRVKLSLNLASERTIRTFDVRSIFECPLLFFISEFGVVSLFALIKFHFMLLSGGQFHQHFMYKFFVPSSFQQLFFSSYVLALGRNSYKKFAHKTLMKLTPGSHLASEKKMLSIFSQTIIF